MLYATGRYAEAEPLYREALERWRAALPIGHPNVASSLNNLATLLWQMHRFSDSESVFRELFQFEVLSKGQDAPATLEAQRCMAAVQRDGGRLFEAEANFRQVIAAAQFNPENGVKFILLSQSGLIKTLRLSLKLNEARQLLSEVLPGALAKLGADHDIVVGLNEERDLLKG